MVDLPACVAPRTASRTSSCEASASCSMHSSATTRLSATILSLRSVTLAESCAHISRSVRSEASICSRRSPHRTPSSPTPSRYVARPPPSASL
eukprot:scaffold28537_cov33-Tisochrysis_lutea.AAC.4